jgi:hypothetical protein
MKTALPPTVHVLALPETEMNVWTM